MAHLISDKHSIYLIVGVVGFAFILSCLKRPARFSWVLGGLATSSLFAIGGSNTHIHLFCLFAIASVVVASEVCPPRQRISWLWWCAVALGTVLMMITGFIGPMVNSRSEIAVILLEVGSGLLVAIYIARGASRRRDVLRGFVHVVSVGAIVAFLQLAHVIHAGIVYQGISGGLGRPAGFFGEPDWLGMYCAVVIAILVLEPEVLSSRRHAVTVEVLCGGACLFSLARASWVAVAGGLAIAFVTRQLGRETLRDRRRLRRHLVRLLAAVGVCVAISLSVPHLRAVFDRRMHTLLTLGTSATDISGQARHQQDEGLLTLAASAPWYGDGLSASGRVGVSGIITYAGQRANNNIGDNWLLSMWVDGKYLSIPLDVALIALCARRSRDAEGAALIVLLINSLASDALLFPATWLFVGLCLAGGSHVLDRSETGARDDDQTYAFA